MRYLFINSVYGIGSTGKIMAQGHPCLVAYGREAIPDSEVHCIRIGNKIDYLTHAAWSRCFDLTGLCSRHATKKFLKTAEAYAPDVIWLHNLHGYYINIELLFEWLKRHPQITVRWTLHDCWAFTGHCPNFAMIRCEKWKTGCCDCTQLKEYPKTYGGDHSRRNYLRKRAAFTGISNMQLITPSKWLADLTRDSFLAQYPVEVVHNTIDLNVFKPTKSDFRKNHGLEDKSIILGVSTLWDKAKGLPDLLKIREMLTPNYVIVVVGAPESLIKTFPEGVLGIGRTKDQTELAAIYTAADVFVNPTHQDNYPTVNLEAAACGTPVVTYNVGGSPESAAPENVVPENDIKGMVRRIRQICDKKRWNEETK